MTEVRKEEIQCRNFRWIISFRGGVLQADGRSNKVNAGRRSLGTRKWDVARKRIHELDEKMAEKLGLIRFAKRQHDVNFKLPVSDGIESYREFIQRPKIAGGIADSTRERYTRSINSFSRHLEHDPIQYWEQFDASYMENMIKELSNRYKPRSVITISTTIRTLHRHLIAHKHLDDRCAFPFEITRPKESTKYCPSDDELRAILTSLKGVDWIFDATAVLAHTGLRFGELAQLSRFDVDLKKSLLNVRRDLRHDQRTNHEKWLQPYGTHAPSGPGNY